MAFVPDADALRGVGPGAAVDELPACVAAVLTRSGSVRSEVLTAPDEYWSEIRHTLETLDAQRPTAFDVDAATDDTRILSLSDGALRGRIAEDATAAAKLLLNVSKMLCVRLIHAG